MGERYDRIKVFEIRLSKWSKGLFLKERMLFEELAELVLEGTEHLQADWNGEQEVKSVLLLLNARMFNDCEAAKQLLLLGLPEQAYMPMRDTIECMMLMRLFQHDGKAVRRWFKKLAEYSPGSVSATLSEAGIEHPEYGWYGMYSQLAHTNLLAATGHVSETDTPDGDTLQTFHFGGYRNEPSTAAMFVSLFLLMMAALRGPLAEIPWSSASNREEWWSKVTEAVKRLPQLDEEVGTFFGGGSGEPLDPRVLKQVASKLQVHRFLDTDQ